MRPFKNKRAPRGRRLGMYSRRGTLIRQFDSVSQAVHYTGMRKGLITPAPGNKPRRTAGGKFYQYIDDELLSGERFRRFTRGNYHADFSNMGRYRNKHGRVTNGNKRDDGYMKFSLGGKTMSIHRVVAALFKSRELADLLLETGVGLDGVQVDHINGQRDDNRVENLQWLTPSRHAAVEAQRRRDQAA